jgi:hypothetical protein
MMPTRIPKGYGLIASLAPRIRCLRSYSGSPHVAPAATGRAVVRSRGLSPAKSARHLRFVSFYA